MRSMADVMKDQPFLVDLVVVVCNGCRAERNFPIFPPFRSADEFIAWEKTKPVTPCPCGYPTADLKLRLAATN